MEHLYIYDWYNRVFFLNIQILKRNKQIKMKTYRYKELCNNYINRYKYIDKKLNVLLMRFLF